MFDLFLNKKSIKVRFAVTVFTNIMRMGLSFLSGIVVARGLGPSEFGNYNFLLTSFVAVTSLLDMGTSSAFYTFISQKNRGRAFYSSYSLWLLAQFIIVVLAVGVMFPDIWIKKIWLGQAKGIILLAFLTSFLTDKIWKTITLVGESIRATIIVQLYTIALTAFYLVTVLLLFMLKLIGIQSLLLSISLIYIIFSLLLARRLKTDLGVHKKDEGDNACFIMEEFGLYCAPLIIYSIVGFAYSFADNWLLQNFGGAMQQGFYAVGLRFSGVSLVLTTSMLSIFWKEIAEANKNGNKERMHYLYSRTLKNLCFMSSAGGCFLFPFTKEILTFVLGPAYVGGWLAVAIMFLFPIPQSIGQVNSIYFYAIGQTKLLSKIGVVMMIISIPISYFILAPASAVVPGLGLGSVGIALKMIIFTVLLVNIYSYFISKRSGRKFEFAYQFISITMLLAASFAIKGIINFIFDLSHILCSPLFKMASCVPFYVLAAAAIVYIFPGLAGLDRVYIRDKIIFLRRKLKW